MRNTLRFVLNGKAEEISHCRPTETVLDFLRERKRLTGTKEGCAEGDCGACTVVLAEPVDGRLRYQAVNACILFLPVLDGKHLITVEALSDEGKLHTVQQAMVDHHGSQCGFCTPGFVMSMFAMLHDPDTPEAKPADINAHLAGNLCRCTGYAPISRAVVNSFESPVPDSFSRSESQMLEQLAGIRSEEMLHIGDGKWQFYSPTRLDQLTEVLDEHPDATMVAGATDVGLWVTKQLREFETLVYTGRCNELLKIHKDENTRELSIGAAVSYSDAMPMLLKEYPGLEEMMIRLGGKQVRNAGTIGGNIANGSPIGDMPPALIALDARLVLSGKSGERTIAIESFFLDYGKQDLRPGECLSRIIIPLPDENQQFRVYKISKRIEQDISAVCAAFSVDLHDNQVSNARVAMGGMAATPKRAAACERALEGQAWDQETIEAAMKALGEDFTPISDMRASETYRMTVARNLLRRFYLETTDVPYPVRLNVIEQHDA